MGGVPSAGAFPTGGGGVGGGTAPSDPVACESLCQTIFSACPIPETDRTICTQSCVGDLQQQSDVCHELQREAMTCIEKALSLPFASCDTVALAIALSCRDPLARAARCRQ